MTLSKARLESRRKKLKEKFKPDFEIKDFEIKNWRANLTDYIPDFKKIWDEKTTLSQKSKFVKEARLDHIIRINPNTHKFPEWNMLESNFQQVIRDAIRRIIE